MMWPLFSAGYYSNHDGEGHIIRLQEFDIALKDGHFTVYNDANPNGFNPDDANKGEPGSPTSGADNEWNVPEGTLFVSGDHRQGNYSLDSRNGLGFIPLFDVIGPVGIRIYPFTGIRTF